MARYILKYSFQKPRICTYRVLFKPSRSPTPPRIQLYTPLHSATTNAQISRKIASTKTLQNPSSTIRRNTELPVWKILCPRIVGLSLTTKSAHRCARQRRWPPAGSHNVMKALKRRVPLRGAHQRVAAVRSGGGMQTRRVTRRLFRAIF